MPNFFDISSILAKSKQGATGSINCAFGILSLIIAAVFSIGSSRKYISFLLLPGRRPNTGLFAFKLNILTASLLLYFGMTSSNKGCPTNSHSTFAFLYIASSKGSTTKIFLTSCAILFTLPERHAHTCGLI